MRTILIGLLLVACGGDDGSGETGEICLEDQMACMADRTCSNACPDGDEACWVSCQPEDLVPVLECEREICGGEAPNRTASYVCRSGCASAETLTDYMACASECSDALPPWSDGCGPC